MNYSYHQNYTRALYDFQRARRAAALQQLLAHFTGTSPHLLAYDEVRQQLHAIEQGFTVLKEIPLKQIVGSVGRYNDFTRTFLPKHNGAQSRWASVKAKMLSLEGVPPIEVYQIGTAYFVRDGNHRVSVARQLGFHLIEAYVTTVQSKVPLEASDAADEVILKAGQTRFLEQTKLETYRPDHNITVTAPGHYNALLGHIHLHQYYMGLELKRDIDYQEAVLDWYDHIYLPTVALIQKLKLMRRLKKRSTADLYLWFTEEHERIEEALRRSR